MKRKYFGTDGIRGVVPQELNPVFVTAIAQSAQTFFRERGLISVVGTDTRVSADNVKAAVVAGLTAAGGTVLDAGVIPTPGVSYLVKELGAAFGTVISASHNPYQYNGVKFFDNKGFKLSDGEEAAIENIYEEKSYALAEPAEVGRYYEVENGVEKYAEYLAGFGSEVDRGLKIVVDCANGATAAAAQLLFDKLGLQVEFLNIDPDGFNINEGCGATHPETVATAVLEKKADVGIAFDGDGDRVIVVDEKGKVLTGDHLIGYIHVRLLPDSPVVGTVMSNMALENYVKGAGREFYRAPVGDRYVLELMLKYGAKIGGEESGHIILLDYASTGDGMLVATIFLNLLSREGKRASEARLFELFPQVKINVAVNNKERFKEDAELQARIKKLDEEMGTRGRLLVRPSGTEPVIRVMAEAEDADFAQQFAEKAADAVKKALGG